MRNNKGLKVAKRAKNDEFYTRYEDIEKEMKYYTQHFINKVIYCNCDDFNKSNFFKYFKDNFNQFKLKKLITTSYINNGKGLYSEYDGKTLITGELKSNGSFDSEESLNYLKEADIVITNPPFSLFRRFMSILFDSNKQFIILGNINAITYKEIFPYIKNNKLWWGNSIHSGDRQFFVPDNYELNAATCGIDENGRKFIRVKGVRWWTNIDFPQRYEELDLYKKYNEEEYPKYDNYDAININKTADIPLDYNGVMGVPITFFDKFCPTQFKILDCNDYRKEGMNKKNTMLVKDKDSAINGKPIYARVLIQRIN